MKTLETVLEANQGLSAHILGVDGWLLRTIPEERRAVFLRLYEKAVRTALHPDLIQDANKKKFYDRYIGRVGEAIAAMCADAATYEAMAEFVPAAKSRNISMDALLAERDAKIDQLRAEIAEKEAAFKAESENFAKTQAASLEKAKVASRMSAASYSVFSQYRSLAENAESYSLNHRFFTIKGNVVDVKFTDDGIAVTERVPCELTKERGTISFTMPGKKRILGAVTLAGLKHCWQTNIIPNAEMEKLVQTFTPEKCDDRTLQLNRYMVSFFKVGMVLVVNHKEKNLLIKINAVDVLDDKAKLEVIRLNEVIASLQESLEKYKPKPIG
jgi:hypothetical protein